MWFFFTFSGAYRRAQISHQSVCLWWIFTVPLTLWRCCLLTLSGPGKASSWTQKHSYPLRLTTWPVRNDFTSKFLSPLLLLFFIPFPFHHFPILSLHIIFCIASPGTATSPWWLGSAAPGSWFVGWTVPRTNHWSACVRLPRGLAQRWLVVQH